MTGISRIGIQTHIGIGGSSSSYWTPRNVVLTATSDTVGITWEGGIGKVERSTDGVNFTEIGSGNNAYSDGGRTANTLYYYCIKGGRYSNIDSIKTTTPLVDADGNAYTEVSIVAQKWLLENLKTTKYNDGSTIPSGLSNANWALEDGSAGHDGAFDQVNGNAGNKAAYGLLYNGHCVLNSKGIAPLNYKIANDIDFQCLLYNVGGALTGTKPADRTQSTAGKHLKQSGTTYWTGAKANDNTSGFTLRAAGYKLAAGTYALLKDYNLSWTKSALNSTNNYSLQVADNGDGAVITNQPKTLGLSVRCIRSIDIFKDTFTGNIIPSMTAVGEPAVLISDDGNQIDLWFTGTVGGVSNVYYCYSTDGLSYSVPQKTNIPDNYKRTGILKENGIYYHFANINGDTSIHLFTSTDKINYTDQGEKIGIGGVGEWDHAGLGNTFVWKDEDGLYKMFYDGVAAIGGYWKTGIATATSLLGPWTKYANNPVLSKTDRDVEGVEMFRKNGKVLKHNGNYVAFQAYGYGDLTGAFYQVEVLHSADLHTWVSDGLISSMYHYVTGYQSYADAAYCEFKGKSYIFMNPSNQVDSAYIDVGVDNRPLIGLLGLQP